MKPLLIRADAGGLLGTGHVMRMIALAQAYLRRDGRVVIASVQCPEPVIDRIQESGAEHRLLAGCELGDHQDASATLKLCEELEADWIVLDGYHFDETYQQQIWNQGGKVLAVDDYGHCETWYCDALLNQNLGSQNRKRGKASKPEMQWLMGSSYALLREEFIASMQRAQEKQYPLKRILITMGGADSDNVTLMVLKALEQSNLAGLKIRVLVGGANLHQNELAQFADSSQYELEILSNVRDMPAMYEWSDAVISAGGSTCWEWLAYGLPGAVVTIAENQEPVVEELKRHKLALALGWFNQFDQVSWSRSLSVWLNDESGYADFNERRNIVDGYGAARVAALLSDNGLWCRPARTGDARLYFEWANDPVVRSSGFHTTELVWKNHCKWFEKMIHDSESNLLVVSNARDEKVGQVRLTPDPSGYLEIGFSVDSNHRGKGVGGQMLAYVLDYILREQKEIKGFIARVKMVNRASAKIFTNQGFEQIEDDPEHKCLVYLKKKQS